MTADTLIAAASPTTLAALSIDLELACKGDEAGEVERLRRRVCDALIAIVGEEQADAMLDAAAAARR